MMICKEPHSDMYYRPNLCNLAQIFGLSKRSDPKRNALITFSLRRLTSFYMKELTFSMGDVTNGYIKYKYNAYNNSKTRRIWEKWKPELQWWMSRQDAPNAIAHI